MTENDIQWLKDQGLLRKNYDGPVWVCDQRLRNNHDTDTVWVCDQMKEM